MTELKPARLDCLGKMKKDGTVRGVRKTVDSSLVFPDEMISDECGYGYGYEYGYEYD